MALEIRRIEYYSTIIEGQAGEESKLLALFAGAGVSLLAFKAVRHEFGRIRFTLFPDEGQKMTEGAKKAGVKLDGPRSALSIQGDDESGALADIFEKLSRAGISVDESNGIANIRGGYGVILYLKGEDCEKALEALRA